MWCHVSCQCCHRKCCWWCICENGEQSSLDFIAGGFGLKDLEFMAQMANVAPVQSATQLGVPAAPSVRQPRNRAVVEALPDASLQWQLPATAGGCSLRKLSVPRAAMTGLGVMANTDCTVRVPSGHAFESRLVYLAKNGSGQIQRLWSDIQKELQPKGGSTISLRSERGAEGQLVLHLAVVSHAPSQVLRPSQYVLNETAS